MDLLNLMHSHQLTRRLPDWRAAALSGIAGGVVFLILDVLAAMFTGNSAWEPIRMIAAIAMGADTLSVALSTSVIVTALIVHFALAVAMGLILGLIIAPYHFDSSFGMASAVGAVFGLAVYLVNFYGMTQFFPWFAEVRGLIAIIGHVAFGIVAADAYLKLERPESGPSI